MATLSGTLEDQISLGAAGAQTIAQILGSPPAGGSAYTGAALTGNAASASQGRWQYSINGGRSWTSLPTNLNVDGSAALLFAADTLIRFAPAADFNGTPGALNLRPLTTAALPWISAAAPYGNHQGFIATWSSYEQDDSNWGVYAQRFSADGTLIGSEFRVNSTTNDSQHQPDLTQLSGGRFLISWQSHNQDGSSWGVYGQLYSPDATPLGGEFRVNTVTNDQQSEPVVAALPDGGFLVSWMSHAQDGDSWGVYAQRYDASGAKTGDETLVNTTTSNQQHSPTIAVLADGSYLIAYQSNQSGGSGWDIYAQRFSSSGTKLGSEIRLNDAALAYSNQYEPSIAALANGGYIATWVDDRRDGSSWGIYARSFSADGTPDAAEFRVNSTTSNQQQDPEVAALADGSYVITWSSYEQDGSNWGVYAQRFSADGTPSGPEFRVNTRTDNDQNTPDITALADGGFVISWTSYEQDGSNRGVYAQRFSADGTPSGSEFRLNSHTYHSQQQVNIASWRLPLQNLTALGLTDLADPIALTLEVTPVNDRPALTGTPTPIAGAAAGQTVSFSAADLLSGYTDIDGDSLSITEVSLVHSTAGTLNGNPDDGWTFSPADNFIGTVELAFSVSDGTTTVADHTSFSIGSGSGGNGSDDNNVLIGTSEADNLSGLAGDDVIDGMDADDTLEGESGSDQLRGGSGNDILRGGDHDDILHGGSGHDHLSGDAGSDQLYGARGNDLIDAGTSDDIATGDAGRDALKGGSGSDQLIGGEGDDFLDGEQGDDLLQGSAGDDWIIGGPGSDDQRGGDGNDTFIAVGTTVSDDIFDGGDGSDTLITGTQSWWEQGANYTDASLRSIERLELLPTPSADRFNLWSWGIDDYSQHGSRFSLDQLKAFSSISGTQAASWSNELFSFSIRELSWDWPSTNWRWLRVAGEGSLDLSATNWDPNTLYRIHTEAGPQTLLGTTNPDWFAGGDGDDILRGLGGDDTLLGETGNDLLEGGSGNDRLEGHAGIDTLHGGEGDDVLIGGGSNDDVYGQGGNDTVELNWGVIENSGGGGADYRYDQSTNISGTYDGGSGSDTLRIQARDWYGDNDGRGDGQTIDLRSASITNFERLDIGTSAILRLTGSQYSQFTSGVSKVAGFEGTTNLAIDLTPGEELRFSRIAGINSASGALNISGTNSAFSDTLAINSDTTVDLSDPDTVISDVETLEIQRGTVILTAEQWNSFDSIRAKGDQTKEIILTDSIGIDLSKFSRSGDSNTTIKLQLSVEQINTQAFEDFSSLFRVGSGSADFTVQIAGGGRLELARNKSQFDLLLDENATYELIGSNAAEVIAGSRQPDTIHAGGGDDTIVSSAGADLIDGGDGTDTLNAGSSTTDLSEKTFENIEILNINGSLVQISAEQFNSFERIIGSGIVQLTTGGTVYSDRNQGSFDLKLADTPTTLVGTPDDDTIRLDITKAGTVAIDGSTGFDVLELTGSGSVDLSVLDRSNIEAINLAGATLRLSTEQYSNTTITGRGALQLSDTIHPSLAAAAEGARPLGAAGAQTIAQILGSPPAGGSAYTGAALTGNAASASQGRWQYSINGGRSWTSLPTNLNVDGSAALLFAADTLIRFAPAADFNGTPGALNLRPLTTAALPWISAAAPYGNHQGFIATWSSYEQDDSNWGVYAQRFSADGTLIGSEFRVNSTTNDSQHQPDLTQLSGGRFLISWQSHNQDGSSWGVYGQLYSPDATPLGGEFRVNTVTNDQQSEPVVAALPDGGFLVSWMSHAQDGDSWGVYAQRYDASGAKTGDETLVNTTTSNQQHSPTIAVLADGSYLIAYQSNQSGGSGWDIYAQRFSSSGTKLGSEIRLNDAALAYSNQYEPSIAALANGGYIATWVDDRRDGSSWGIYARSFSADGTPDAAEFRVNSTTSNQQQDPEVAALADGSYVITWSSYEQDGSNWGVYAQRFSADGTPSGPEFRVNTRTDNDQNTPDITALADGGFVISWTSYEQDGSNRGVYAQRFSADGTPSGSEFRLNSHTYHSQQQVNIASWRLPLQNLTALGLTDLADPIALTLEVTPVNDRPALTGTPTPIAGAAAGQTVSFSAADLLSGYTDIDGDSLSITEVSLVHSTAGTLNGNPDDGWTFSPADNFIGTVELAFSVSDGTTTVADHTSFSIGSGSGGNGSDDNNVLIGTSEADNLSGLAGDDVIDGMDADDTLEGESGSDQLRGGSGNDILRGGDHDDILHGGSGHDHLSGDAGSDQLYGARGNDLIDAGTSDDIATGDAGRDALKGGSGSDQLIGGEGDDFLDGEQGDDLLQGSAGDDWIIGGPGSDDQRGGDGNDTFIAVGTTVSDDIFDGGDGSDTLITGTQSWWEQGANYTDASLRSIERLELLPTPSADRFNLWSWGIDDYSQHGSRFSLDQLKAFSSISGTQAASWSNELFSFSIRELSWDWPSTNWRWLRVAGEGSLDLSATNWDPNTLYRIHTEAGPQTLLGTTNPDWFAGGDGDDILRGLGGDDTLLGETGNDLLEGGSGNDRLEGHAGIDTLHGGEGDDVLIGGGSNDDVYGQGGNDTVELNWGVIENSGGGGADYRYDQSTNISGTYDGGSGSDTLRIQARDWYGDNDGRGDGQTIDLRSASITNFERLDIGTSAILRLTGSQYSQFTSGVSKVAGFEGTTNLAIDLTPGEELRFSRIAGINSASGALNISGTNSAFSDTLAINSDTTVDLSDPDTVISDVETLEIQRGTVILTAEQWNSFDSIRAKGDQTKEIILTDSIGIDLSKFSRSGDSNTTIKLQLSVEQINTPSFKELADRFSFSDQSTLSVAVTGEGTINSQEWPLGVNFDVASADFAHLAVQGDENDNLFELRLLGSFNLDGGAGDDTLLLAANSDLSAGELQSIEALDLNGNQAVLSSAQFNALSRITGSGMVRITDTGRLFVKHVDPTGSFRVIQPSQAGDVLHEFGSNDHDILHGDSLTKGSHDRLYGLSGDDDLLGGQGHDQLAGGLGNDWIDGGGGFNTAVFTDNQANYRIDFNGREIRVEHLEGGSDGIDRLIDIQKLSFADSDFSIDDITNQYDPSLGANSELGKRNRDTIDYGEDNEWSDNRDWDNWSFPLIANSRIEITKVVHEGSPSGSKVWFDGDFHMNKWETVKEFNVESSRIHNIRTLGTHGVDYGITARMIDDKPNNSSTTSVLADPNNLPAGSDPSKATSIGGFIGVQEWGIGGVPQWDASDEDWIRVDLVGGIQYEFKALGASSLPATGLEDPYLQQLRDPQLLLLDEQGETIEEGQLGGQGQDPTLVYRAQRTGAYFLAVSSNSGLYTGGYTVTRTSLDEYGGDINTNGELNLNLPIEGVINTEGDQDWFRVSLDSGERLVLEAMGSSTNNGTLRDPWLGVYSSSGQLLVSDNNGGRGLDSRLSWAAPTAGTYYVAAGSLGNQGRGSYTIRARRKEDDGPDRLSSAFSYTMVSPGLSVTGDLEVRSDHDWFQTVLQEGRTYRISLSGERSFDSDYDPLRDPALALRNAAGVAIDFDDDSGDGLNAELFFTPSSTGRFYLEAQDATGRYDGHYRLSIEEAVDDYGDTIDSAADLGLVEAQERTGRLDHRGDKDIFSIALEEGFTYRFDLAGLSSGQGSLADPRLRLLSADGERISGDDNAGLGNDASFYFASNSDQTLYLEASAAAGQLGSYSLMLNKTDLAADDVGNDPSTDAAISVGGTRSGTLLTPGDHDWFRITLEAGQYYRFRLDGIDNGGGTLEDPYLELRDEGGTLLVSADHGTLTRNAALGFEAPNSGTYYVVARGSDAAHTGSYTLQVFAPDEAGAGFNQAKAIAVNSSQRAAIQSSDDRDWFRFTAQGGEMYTLTVTSDALDAGGLPIAITELFDETGTTLATADGRYTDGAASLAFKAEATGTYALAVRGYWGRTGSYSISLDEGNLADAAGTSPETSIELEMDSSIQGLLEVTGDRDWFSVVVESGHTYRFRLSSDYDAVAAPLADPMLTLLGVSSDGAQELAFNDNRDSGAGISLDSEITYQALEDGVLYLEAAGSQDLWQGGYRLQATDLGLLNQDDHPNTIAEDPTVLLGGQPQGGVIERSTDVDLFRINLEAGVDYQVLVRGESSNGGTLMDPQFRVLDPDGTAVAAAFDGIGNPDASLSIKVLNDATYYLEVSAAAVEGNLGSYTAELLEANSADADPSDLPANKNTEEHLQTGYPLEGKIHTADDVDWIRVEMEAGKLYVFDAAPRIVNSFGGWNPAMELIDGNGIRLSSDQDAGEGLAARIVHQARSTGTYYLSVRSQDGSTGIYELSQKELISGNSDPLMSNQWHLNNANGLDLNLNETWEDFSGSGIRVGVIDDGINYQHPDLVNNLDLIRDKAEDFFGRVYDDANLRLKPKPESGHGTSVAGLIAAERFNEVGISGVAYEANIAGYEVDWSIHSIASMLRLQANSSIGGMDITNNSWGFTSPFADDFDSPLLEPLAETLETGVNEGRLIDGEYLGVNWVFSAGNSRSQGDNTNYHNFQNSRFVTTVAATDSEGNTSSFSTPGASILVSAFGEDLFTTSLTEFDSFTGTSGAAPLVSGVIALMLEANPTLGYRDVQTILAYSAREEASEGFKTNGALDWNGGGLHISHDQGFGLVDAHAAVRLAETWGTTAQTAENEVSLALRPDHSGEIPDDSELDLSFSLLVERDINVEWAEVELDLRHQRTSDLQVELVSPYGTVAQLIDRPRASNDNPQAITGPYSDSSDRIIFTTSASLFRGESSVGNWTVRFRDLISGETGELRQWGLKLHGSQASTDDVFIYTDEFADLLDERRSVLLDGLEGDDPHAAGYDTINAAAVSSDSLINLTPGSTSQIAKRELSIETNTWIDAAIGGDGDDVISGNQLDNALQGGRGNDRFIASSGNDHIDGGRGFDQLIINANRSDFELLQIDGAWTLTDLRKDRPEHYGQDTLNSIERIIFNDEVFDLNLNNRAPTTVGSLPDLGFGSNVIFSHILDSSIFEDLDVQDANGDSLSYNLQLADGRDLPGWLTFNAASLELIGEPYDAINGNYTLELTATDSFGASTSLEFALTIAGNSSDATDPTAPPSVAWDLLIPEADEPELGFSVGDSVVVSITAADIVDPDNPQSVFSAYADLEYDHKLLRAVSIEYGDNFNLFQSGSIDNSSGLINDLGAMASTFEPISNTIIANVEFEALSPGSVELALKPSISPFFDTTVYGLDGDQRAFSRYESDVLSLRAPLPDIAVSQLFVSNAVAQQGLVELNYELSNHGNSNSTGFWANLYLSDDEELDTTTDPLVWRRHMEPDAITGLSSTGLINTSVQLPRDLLYAHALDEDPLHPEFGTISNSADWLFLQVESESAEGDSLALNNTRSDAITYFPWDVDGNGKVTMSDAIEMVNRIGAATPSPDGFTLIHDLNGDQSIDQLETMAVSQRIGLAINTNIL